MFGFVIQILIISLSFILQLRMNYMDLPRSNVPLLSIIWSAPFFSGGGYCSEAIEFYKSLQTVNISIGIVQHGDSMNNQFIDSMNTSLLYSMSKSLHYLPNVHNSICVCHSEPGAWTPALYSTTVCPNLGCRYTIGRTMFESDRLPNGWKQRLESMDEIWIPSHFMYTILQKENITESKIYIIPEAVDTILYTPIGDQYIYFEDHPLYKQDTFKYFSVFKYEPRKGINLLLKAYITTFTKNDHVALYLLTHSYKSNNIHEIYSLINAICKETNITIAQRPFISIISDYISDNDLAKIYRSVNIYVLPTHGEGWGRPLQEALSSGLSVITTNWSGLTEFVNNKNSYLIDIDGLIELPNTSFKGHLYANPSIIHLKQLLLYTYKHPHEVYLKGKQGRKEMVQKYSEIKIGQLLYKEILRISNKLYSQYDEN